MHSIMQDILRNKEREVASLKADSACIKKACRKNFREALVSDELSIIAEIKRKSPSKGNLSAIKDPNTLALEYVKGGANAISILTDEKYFSGNIEDLKQVSHTLENTDCPILRKDFIINENQLKESIEAGADAVLLIVSALKEKTVELFEKAKALNIDALVEVHDKTELRFAIDIGAEIIGINNRNLNTFNVDINTSFELINDIPSHIVKVSESGIRSSKDAQLLKNVGFDAVLIGEALVTHKDPASFIKQLRGQQ